MATTLEALELKTSLGVVPVWGRLEDRARPLLFVVRGAVAEFEQFQRLTDWMPEADVALVHLPGMHTPYFARNSLQDFAAAFDEVLTVLGYSSVVVMGLSIGGVVAMAMKHPSIRRLALFDTPLTTAELWPLREVGSEPKLAGWLTDIFAVAQGGRDYRPILAALSVPATLLLGSDPLLPPRAGRLPSLVGPADRQTYRRHPLVRSLVVEDTGHNVGQKSDVTLRLLRWALVQAMQSA